MCHEAILGSCLKNDCKFDRICTEELQIALKTGIRTLPALQQHIAHISHLLFFCSFASLFLYTFLRQVRKSLLFFLHIYIHTHIWSFFINTHPHTTYVSLLSLDVSNFYFSSLFVCPLFSSLWWKVLLQYTHIDRCLCERKWTTTLIISSSIHFSFFFSSNENRKHFRLCIRTRWELPSHSHTHAQEAAKKIPSTCTEWGTTAAGEKEDFRCLVFSVCFLLFFYISFLTNHSLRVCSIRKIGPSQTSFSATHSVVSRFVDWTVVASTDRIEERREVTIEFRFSFSLDVILCSFS